MQGDLGVLEVERVDDGGALSATVIARASRSGDWLGMEFELEQAKPHGLLGIRISVTSEEPRPSVPLDAASRAAAIEAIAAALAENYVFPETGDQMSASLLRSLASGAYDSITSEAMFARRLTDDLRAICNDRHLSVRPGTMDPEVAEEAQLTEADLAAMRRDNFAFRKTEILPGNIGYVKFDGFSGVKEAEPTAAAAMNFVAHCDALILDLRENGGGSPDMINFICGYLFDSPTLLNRFYNRPTDSTTESYSRAEVPGPRFGQTKPVYVLTSAGTFSGAEELCYDLQNLKRGIVVGEVTGGGAHPVMGMPAGDRFIIRVPYARAINPVTETNWEGVGIKPDIEVPADRALDAAVEAARKQLQQR
jgi:hypothetical protein